MPTLRNSITLEAKLGIEQQTKQAAKHKTKRPESQKMKVAEILKTLEYGPAPEAAKPALDWIAEHEGKFQLFIGNEWKNPFSKEFHA